MPAVEVQSARPAGTRLLATVGPALWRSPGLTSTAAMVDLICRTGGRTGSKPIPALARRSSSGGIRSRKGARARLPTGRSPSAPSDSLRCVMQPGSNADRGGARGEALDSCRAGASTRRGQLANPKPGDGSAVSRGAALALLRRKPPTHPAIVGSRHRAGDARSRGEANPCCRSATPPELDRHHLKCLRS